jgi:hypothetical protein
LAQEAEIKALDCFVVKLEDLDVTVLRRGVGEVRVVAVRVPTC